jgi:hypothetical protein
MAAAAASIGRPNAASALADIIERHAALREHAA